MSEAEDSAASGAAYEGAASAPTQAVDLTGGDVAATAAAPLPGTLAAAGSGEPERAADRYLGTLIGQRYRIIEPLGEGGMGLVFRGEHTLMKKPIAIKLLHRELGAVEDAVERFKREAQSASLLSHPSIVAVTDFGRAESGELFLVMEYVAGKPLSEVLEEHERFQPQRATTIARLILRGLTHAHAAGVVHRDLKPANIMIQSREGAPDGPGTVKILDFGIAKMTQTDAGDGGAALTRGGMIFGTPSYMSPEQATGESVDHRADLYACGVILYEMLTGRKPFIADDLVKVMAQQVTAAPPPFARVAPDAGIPAALEAVVMKALQKDRSARYQSAQEFLEALDEAEFSAGPLAWLAPHLSRARELLVAEVHNLRTDSKRRRIVAGALGVMLLFAIVPAFCGEPNIAPKQPVAKSLVLPLEEAEQLIGAGRLTAAKGILMQELSRHPKSARIRFQLGTIAFLENSPASGIEHYGDALKLDSGLRADPTLLLNVTSLLKGGLAESALSFLIERVGTPAKKAVAEVASTDKRLPLRRQAREACDELGCLAEVDLVESYSLDLSQEKTCARKREIVELLADTGDERAIPVLKKAVRGGSALHRLFGFDSNRCLGKVVKDALEKLEG